MLKYLPGRLFMYFLRIYPSAPSNPNFLSLASYGLRGPVQKLHLKAQFILKPIIIGVKKRDPGSTRILYSLVPGR